MAALLCLHCLWFATMHFAWACGWRWGVPADIEPISERPVFLTYDVLAGLCLIGLAVYTARLASIPGTRSRRGARLLMGAVTVVCGLRGGVGAIGDLVALGQGQALSTLTVLADLWFIVAALLAACLWRAMSRHRIHPRG